MTNRTDPPPETAEQRAKAEAEAAAAPFRQELDRLRAEIARRKQPNPLAAELREILTDLAMVNPGAGPNLAHERLLRLAEHIERLASDPVEVDASTELTASFGGLEPEQEIRADALVAAARLLAPTLAGKQPPATQADVESLARRWLELAQYGEAWVSTGGACGCTVVDDPECPLHGAEPRRRSTDR